MTSDVDAGVSHPMRVVATTGQQVDRVIGEDEPELDRAWSARSPADGRQPDVRLLGGADFLRHSPSVGPHGPSPNGLALSNIRSILGSCGRSTVTNPVERHSIACATCHSRGRSTRTWAASIDARSASCAHSSAWRTARGTAATARRSGSRRTSSMSSAASWRAGRGNARGSSSGRPRIRISRPRDGSA